MRKGKIISGDTDSSDSKSRYLDEMHEIIRAVDWNDFYILLRWFHSKLKDCSYSAIIKPNGKKKEENEKKKAEIFYSKSLLEKHYDEKNRTKHFYDARNKIWLYTSLQEYLNKDKKGLLKLTKRLKSSNINPYPVVQIKFNHDSVEIGELQEKKIVMKKYSLIEKNKIPKFEEYEKRISKPIFPMVIFPDREKFVDENYIPPFSRIDDSSLDELIESKKKNP